MLKQKFKGYSNVHGLSDPCTLKHLMYYGKDLLLRFDTFIQYLGYSDFKNTEVYEGDVLELKITDELMNHKENMFFNSNIGKYIEEQGNITSIILLNKYAKQCMSLDYELYFCRDGKIEREEDGSLSYHTIGDDKMFPQYLCCKGAVIIGNIVVDKDIL